MKKHQGHPNYVSGAESPEVFYNQVECECMSLERESVWPPAGLKTVQCWTDNDWLENYSSLAL